MTGISSQQMVYGDGDGSLFNRFTISVDAIGHELTHGVTQYEASLSYQDDPGALNESMSEVFGSMVKQFVKKTEGDQGRLADRPGAADEEGSWRRPALNERAGHGLRRSRAWQGSVARQHEKLRQGHAGQRRRTDHVRHPESRVLSRCGDVVADRLFVGQSRCDLVGTIVQLAAPEFGICRWPRSHDPGRKRSVRRGGTEARAQRVENGRTLKLSGVRVSGVIEVRFQQSGDFLGTRLAIVLASGKPAAGE